MRETVTLAKSTTSKGGKQYTYWVLRWFDPNGRRRAKTIGAVGSMSHRQAEKGRREKQAELEKHPGRRNTSVAPSLEDYLKTYEDTRRCELGTQTLELHKMTGRYLVGYFGKTRRIDKIQRADARAFRASLAANELAHVCKRAQKLSEASVHMHIRNAKTILQNALDDDLIPFNPFDRLAGTAPPPKAWHEVTDDEFAKLMSAARPAWQTLLALILPAALRALADEIESRRAIGSAGSLPERSGGGPTVERSGSVAAGDTIEAGVSEPSGSLANAGRPPCMEIHNRSFFYLNP